MEVKKEQREEDSDWQRIEAFLHKNDTVKLTFAKFNMYNYMYLKNFLHQLLLWG